MAKLVPMNYYNSKGEKKINCYYITIPKKIVDNSRININKKIKVNYINKKIILEEDNGK